MNAYSVTNTQIQTFHSLCQNAVGGASESLSKLAREPVHISATKSGIVDVTALYSKLGKAEDLATTIILKINQGIPGVLVITFPQNDGKKFALLLTGSTQADTTILTDLEISALKEAGNIIAGAFLAQLSNILKMRLIQSYPALATDMLKATLDEVSAETAQSSGNALSIMISFTITPLSLSGRLLFLLPAASANTLFEKLPL